jgi:hypothetical protein
VVLCSDTKRGAKHRMGRKLEKARGDEFPPVCETGPSVYASGAFWSGTIGFV